MFTNYADIDVIRNTISQRLQSEGFMPDTPNFKTLFQRLAGFPYDKKPSARGSYEY